MERTSALILTRDEKIVHVVRAQLSLCGCTVTTAHGLGEGAYYAAQRTFQIIAVDADMLKHAPVDSFLAESRTPASRVVPVSRTGNIVMAAEVIHGRMQVSALVLPRIVKGIREEARAKGS